MTEDEEAPDAGSDDGETPDAESDDDGDDGRTSEADSDGPTSPTGTDRDGDRSTRDADSERPADEPTTSQPNGRDDDPDPAADDDGRSAGEIPAGDRESPAGDDRGQPRGDEDVEDSAAGPDGEEPAAGDRGGEPDASEDTIDPGRARENPSPGAGAEYDPEGGDGDEEEVGSERGTSSHPVDGGADAESEDGDEDGWDAAAGLGSSGPGGPEMGDDDPGAGAARGEGSPGVAGEFDEAADSDADAETDVPPDVRSYDRFKKVDRASYDRVNEFLRDRTYVTAREWAIARLCADFRTATGVEMTKIGENLPHLVPFMTDTYSPQAVNQARSAFEEKVRMAGATFLYGAMSGFFTADELDEIMYEVTEVAKFLLEVEGVELTVDEELDAEDRISAVMREVRQASEELRYDDIECPECGHQHRHPGAEAEIE